MYTTEIFCSILLLLINNCNLKRYIFIVINISQLTKNFATRISQRSPYTNTASIPEIIPLFISHYFETFSLQFLRYIPAFFESFGFRFPTMCTFQDVKKNKNSINYISTGG